MLNHNEEYLRSIERKFLFNPIQIKWAMLWKRKKIEFLESFSFWNQFICILLLSVTFKFLCLLSSLHSPLLPLHLPPAAPASSSPEEKPEKPFSSSCSLFNFFISYYSMYALICIYYYSTYYIIIYCFIIIQLIFNIIFLCMILPAWGTLDCEKLDICFLHRKDHLSYVSIPQSFFSVEYENTKLRNDIIFSLA